MINISAETPHARQINTHLIKQVVAGDWVTGRHPYGPPMKFRPYAKHYLAMNQTPVIADNSFGMWRRIWVIRFSVTFSDQEADTGLEEKLALELSGIFNWALEGYRRLKKNNFKLKDVPSLKLARKEYRDNVDPLRTFAKELLIRSNNPEDRLKFKDVYESYISFCQKWKKDAEKRNDFRKQLEELGFKIANSTKDSNQLFIFNVRMASEEDEI